MRLRLDSELQGSLYYLLLSFAHFRFLTVLAEISFSDSKFWSSSETAVLLCASLQNDSNKFGLNNLRNIRSCRYTFRGNRFDFKYKLTQSNTFRIASIGHSSWPSFKAILSFRLRFESLFQRRSFRNSLSKFSFKDVSL